jgi:hypothetical protein
MTQPPQDRSASQRFSWLMGAALSFGLWVGGPVWALEFSADQITKANGKTRTSNIFYRDDRWRLEHQDTGPVNVTIVRKDKQVVWMLLSRLKHFKEVPYESAQDPKVQETMVGEVSRNAIGTETLDGRQTTLYEIHVQEGGRIEDYYQWLATDIHFPLKLMKKDGSWSVEYRRLRIGSVSDFLFQLPLNFQPLESFDGPDQTERPSKSPESKM